MPILWTDDDYRDSQGCEHACPSCGQPCDCDGDADECSECYYCNEERFDRDIRESEDNNGDDTDE